MKKRPFRKALLVLGVIFLLFFAGSLVLSGLTGGNLSFALGNRIGVVEVSGVIDSSREIVDEISRFRDDRSIRAVVLRVDSPGGGVGPSQEIYQEIKKLTAVKPVVVSMGSVAASGGYYVAAPAAMIVANPGTITGSIGVIMEITNFQELMEKIGLQSHVVKSGEHKDIGSPVRPMREEDRRILQSVVEDVHRQFIEAVVDGRQLAAEDVALIADGRIFTGRQAMEAGLVDELGNLQDAIRIAAEIAEIAGEPRIIYPARKRTGWLDYLAGEAVSGIQRGLQQRVGSGLQFLYRGVQ